MTTRFTPLQPTTIVYESSGVSPRTIIPTTVPSDSITALDVSSLAVTEREAVLERYKEYQKYVESRKALISSFEDWASQAYPTFDTSSLNWRRFKLDKIK